MALAQRLKDWAMRMKRDIIAVWLAARDPATPLTARIIAMAVAGYAVSPIDLIPDFIPVLGYLDDLLLVPLGLWLAIRLIPPALMASCRVRAQTIIDRPQSRIAALVIIGIWVAMTAAVTAWLFSDHL